MRPLEPVLVTGASGFLGAAVLRQLRTGGVSHVVATSRRRPPVWDGEWIAADLLVARHVRDMVRAVHPRTVLHLAGTPRKPHANRQATDRANKGGDGAESSPATDDAHPLCAQGARNIVEALADLRAARAGDPPRLIVAGSSAAYGVREEAGETFAETNTPRPAGAYGRAKLEEERILAGMNHQGGDAVIARLFNLVGAGQPRGLMARDVLEELRARRDEPGWWREDPARFAHARDLVDVGDAARALLFFARIPRPPTLINVCTGRAVSAWTVLEELRGLAGDLGPDDKAAAPPLRSWQAGNPALANSLGWTARIPLSRSLRNLADTVS